MLSIHAARRAAFFCAVSALLLGGKAWLSALGRSRASGTSDKHGIKAVDRLLGNRQLWKELTSIYAALAVCVLKKTEAPVVLVDASEVRPGVYALTASLAFDGRGIPLYGIVRSKRYACTRRCQRQFLRGLQHVLPAGVQPVLVTDAGFESPWFDEVERLGWNYVGRVRHQTKFLDGDAWLRPQDLHRRASNRAKSLGHLPFPRRCPKARRIVLSKARTSKGRKRLTTRRTPGRNRTDRRCEKRAREPWLLATSLSACPAWIVEIYALRMQIEENYRDVKNHRWGWALDQTRSRTHKRIEVLLVIAAVACLIQLMAGVAAETDQLQFHFQANTERRRRVISLFVLGRFVLAPAHQHLLTSAALRRGFDTLLQKIRTVTNRSP
jgi:hypothetical protein